MKLSTEQRDYRFQALTNLAKAQEVRTKRARIKDRIRSGALPLEIVLAKDMTYLRSMQIGKLLQCVPHLGPEKTRKALRANHIVATTELRRVSFDQRKQLVRWLKDRYPATVRDGS